MKDIAALYQQSNAATIQEVDRSIYVNYNYPPHLHSRLELIYMMNGTVKINIDGTEEIISESEYCMVLPWQVHSFETLTYSKMIIFVLPVRIVSTFTESMKNLHGESQVFKAEKEIDQLFQKYMVENAECNEYIMTSIVYGLCHCFLSSCKLVENEDRERSEDMQRVLKYISESSSEKLDLRTVADELGYNYYYLSRLFTKEAKIGFYEFCSAIRIESAMTSLRNGNSPVTQIAYECGFSSIRTFNRAFKRIVGMSPSEYRMFAKNNPFTYFNNRYLAAAKIVEQTTEDVQPDRKE